MRLALVISLILFATGCSTQQPANPAPRYVWYCHIAGGAGCTGEMIRCWDRQIINWVEDDKCAAIIDKPKNLVNNQSYPPVSRSALMPGR